MGRLTRFCIKFDNPIATYHTGQNVTGKVIVHLREPIEMRGVYLVLLGKAQVRWKTEKDTYHTNKEIYFDIKQILWGTGEREEMKTGQYEFLFTLSLPDYLPTTFESDFGYVRYHCEAYIDRPWKSDPKCKSAFTVLTTLDLNTVLNASQPITKENSRKVGWWCCTSGSVAATFSINKVGFVPGERMILNGTIQNQSSCCMAKSYVVLEQHILYEATGGFTKEVTNKVAEVEQGPIPEREGDAYIWVNHPLIVPSIPPTGGCDIIQIEYFVVFGVKPDFGGKLEIEIPVVIGTIPLQANFESFSSPMARQIGNPSSTSNYASYEPSDIEMQLSSHSEPLYPNMPPPSYEECVTGRVNILDDNDGEYTAGQLDYAPRYTYYHQRN